LYGHEQANLHLTVAGDQVAHVLRRGGRLVDLTGDASDTALIRQVQWDPFGVDVLHLDLLRVSAEQSVEVTLPVVLRGTAAGVKEGGVVEHIRHEAHIRCPVLALPDKLELNISSLQLDKHLTFADIPLPAGAEMLSDPEEQVVHSVLPLAVEEEAAAPAEPGEPEVIGRKKEEEGEEEAEE
jgi:large subunit ribosomal protein L25